MKTKTSSINGCLLRELRRTPSRARRWPIGFLRPGNHPLHSPLTFDAREGVAAIFTAILVSGHPLLHDNLFCASAILYPMKAHIRFGSLADITTGSTPCPLKPQQRTLDGFDFGRRNDAVKHAFRYLLGVSRGAGTNYIAGPPSFRHGASTRSIISRISFQPLSMKRSPISR
jgi:hypothetical protein